MPQEQNPSAFVTQLLSGKKDKSLLLQYLVSIQHRFAGIPQAALTELARQLQINPGEIASVAGFYSFLNIHDGSESVRYRILFSDNITDRFAGNQALLQQLEGLIEPGLASIEFTSCSGLCDQGPGLLVNGMAINRVDSARVERIAALVNTNTPVDQWPADWFAIEDNIRRSDMQLSHGCEPGQALHEALKNSSEALIEELDEAGLRGRGGAGFKTATKWRFCREAEGDTRYVVCNADEGEPGTFKDRVLLNRHADEVFEGMTLCARAIGARQGLVYLRGEYRFLLEPLNAVLQKRRENGLLGQNVCGVTGFDFDIEIHLGAGAYICGEESALIESLEGKRGNPRIRPPFPVQQGYLGQPTVVNNVETFWSVTHIALRGANWFREEGTAQSSGTRLLSISGDCARPGIYEYPFGISLREILEDCGGSDAQAIQMAGAAGNLVLAKDFDRCMSFEDLATGGSFMVIGAQRNLLELLGNFAEFFQHESCGFCTPCRVGSRLIHEFIEQFRAGQGSSALVQQLRDVCALMQRDSFCGLGTSAPTVFVDALEDCPELFETAPDSDDGPVFDLDQALGDFRQIVEKGVP